MNSYIITLVNSLYTWSCLAQDKEGITLCLKLASMFLYAWKALQTKLSFAIKSNGLMVTVRFFETKSRLRPQTSDSTVLCILF